MNISISKTSEEMGRLAAAQAAQCLNKVIAEKGGARILLSTGASQFPFFDALVKEDVAWEKVEMFHLDEYINLPATHPASFRKYLQDRFISKVNLKHAYLVNADGDYRKHMEELAELLRENPIDLGVIGIGENGHIAFNDPPADFAATTAYRVVDLDERCRKQQVGEGWFASVEDVPKQAISMTVPQIMKSKVIISIVPHRVKAEAVYNTLTRPVSNTVPATILKTHPDWTLFLDYDSAGQLFALEQ